MRLPLCLMLSWHYVASAPDREPPEDGVSATLKSMGLLLMLTIAVVAMMRGQRKLRHSQTYSGEPSSGDSSEYLFPYPTTVQQLPWVNTVQLMLSVVAMMRGQGSTEQNTGAVK